MYGRTMALLCRIEETKAQKKQVDTERETILARQSHNLERLENSRSQLKEAHQALATQQQTYATTQSDLQKLKCVHGLILQTFLLQAVHFIIHLVIMPVLTKVVMILTKHLTITFLLN